MIEASGKISEKEFNAALEYAHEQVWLDACRYSVLVQLQVVYQLVEFCCVAYMLWSVSSSFLGWDFLATTND